MPFQAHFLSFTFVLLLTCHIEAQEYHKVDIIHTDLQLALDWQKKSMHGTATIQFKLPILQDTLILDAHQLSIHQISDNNEKKLFYRQDAHHLFIKVPYTNHNQSSEITIKYNTIYADDIDPKTIGGSFGKGLRWIEAGSSSPNKKKQLFAQSVLGGCSYWFPCHDVYDDYLTCDITIIVDTTLTAIASGHLIDRQKIGLDQYKYIYHSKFPQSASSTNLIVGPYAKVIDQNGTKKIYTYCYAEEYEAARSSAIMMPDMMQFIEKETGYTYPFDCYSQVVVQDYPFPSIGSQHMTSTISDNMVDDHCTHEDYKYLWDGVQANALFSQWFGQVIQPKSAQDQWLATALAYYYEGLWTAQLYGETEYLLWYLPWELSSLQAAYDAKPHGITDRLLEEDQSLAYDGIVKFKGAMVMRLLRFEIGDENFKKAMHQFLQKYAFQAATASDFIYCVENACGQSMQWFFDQWLYSRETPQFDFNTTYDLSTNVLIVNVHQKNALNTQQGIRAFRGKIELSIDNQSHLLTLNDSMHNRFVIPVSILPKSIIVDPHHYYPTTLSLPTTHDEHQHILTHSSHALARKTALQWMAEKVSSQGIHSTIADSFSSHCTSLLLQKEYWRWKVLLINTMSSIYKDSLPLEWSEALIHVIEHDSNWVKATAITALGMARLAKYESIYTMALQDCSDRVVSAAAIALGKIGSHTAIASLVKLKNRPSWKNQSLMHAINGLSQCHYAGTDQMALEALQDVHSPRWYLGNGWDYPYVAAQYLGQSASAHKALEIIASRIDNAVKVHNIFDLFYQVNLLIMLNSTEVKDMLDRLKTCFKNDTTMMDAIAFYEQIWNDNMTSFNK